MKTALNVAVALTFILTALSPVRAEEAPNVPLYDLDGSRHVLHAMAGELPEGGVIILNFTSVNCAPCRREIPELLAIAGNSKKVRLVLVYAETAREPEPHARSFGARDRAFVDPLGAVQAAYGVKRHPVTLVIDGNGRIAGRFEGYTPANMEAIGRLAGASKTRIP
jgi:thiol-disulfide isomerase/thioredoxin